ncbi:MAG: hypothetical protein K6G25_03810 [Bacteroidales bacterium]|nr:hypothetical protein [Bacteroidales bacterium]
MKKVSTILMCFAVMLTMSLNIKAQDITITLNPRWTWISYPKAEVMDVATALGDFVPMEGDIIKSQYAFTVYENGSWSGNMQQFDPGLGYMYYSNRTENVSFLFASSIQLTVTTYTLSEITGYSASCGGSVVLEDNSFVLMKGVCWATHQNPIANDDFHSEDGTGNGSFTAYLTNLSMNTVYYVRAYAVTASGVTYGEELSFTTRGDGPEVSTTSVTGIFEDGATCGGSVTDDGGLEVTAKGICWSTAPNPTINDDHTVDGAGLGEFTSVITGLTNNTTYYVRAYATNDNTTSYGNEVSFTTSQIWENGILPGLFSIHDSTYVSFSQGNLQYIGSAETPYWRFATHQWNCLGSTTGQNSNSQNVDRDLFGWGTSGYHDTIDQYNVNYQPWSTSSVGGNSNYNYYGYGPSINMPSTNLTGSSANYDWGVYNAIDNGGNQHNQWRTLTGNEWNYLFTGRNTESGILYARGCVDGMNGIILLPDNWSASIYVLNYTNNVESEYGSNIISADDWTNILEANGAVFLPAAGCRSGTTMDFVGSYAIYWSTSRYNGNSNANTVYSTPTKLFPFSSRIQCSGISVRLVRDVVE